MQIFKCFVSKATNKYNIVIKANSETEAKNKLHKEGYSILSMKKIEKIDESGNKFYFKAMLNGEKKSGSVIAKDIFKIYFKLRDGLKYEILELYSNEDKNLSDDKKKYVLKNLEEQYKIFKEFNKKKKKLINKKTIEKKVVLNTQKHEHFYMHTELTKTHYLIDKILEKLKEFIDKKNIFNLDFEQEESLGNIYNSIIKIKKSTNYIKLKKIGELALLKIGNIVLDKIEENKKNINFEKNDKKLENYRLELKNINLLLKKTDSKENLKEKSKDFFKILSNFFVSEENNSNNKIKKEFIDKSSSSYLKSLVLLRKYKEKSTENNKKILKKIHLFILPDFILKFLPNFKENIENIEYLILRKEVINQNINILKAKTEKSLLKLKIKKLYNYILGPLINIFKIITVSGFYIILIFSVFFIIFNLKNYFSLQDVLINYWGLFYFLAFFLFLYSLNFAKKYLKGGFKGLFISLTNFFIFILIFIFGLINF